MSYRHHDDTFFWVTRDVSIQKPVNALDISILNMIDALDIPSEHRYCYLRQMEAQHLDDFQNAKLAMKDEQISSLRYEPGSELHQLDQARIERLEIRNSDWRVIAGQLYSENKDNRMERDFEFSSAAKMRRERNKLREVVTVQNTEIMKLRKSNDLYKQENNLCRQENECYEMLHAWQKITIDTQTAQCEEFQRKLDNLDLDWKISQKMRISPCHRSSSAYLEGYLTDEGEL